MLYESSSAGSRSKISDHPIPEPIPESASFSQSSAELRNGAVSGKAYLVDFRNLIKEIVTSAPYNQSEGSAINITMAASALARFVQSKYGVPYSREREGLVAAICAQHSGRISAISTLEKAKLQNTITYNLLKFGADDCNEFLIEHFERKPNQHLIEQLSSRIRRFFEISFERGLLAAYEPANVINPGRSTPQWKHFKLYQEAWAQLQPERLVSGEISETYAMNQASFVHTFLEFVGKQAKISPNIEAENAAWDRVISEGRGVTRGNEGSTILESLLSTPERYLRLYLKKHLGGEKHHEQTARCVLMGYLRSLSSALRLELPPFLTPRASRILFRNKAKSIRPKVIVTAKSGTRLKAPIVKKSRPNSRPKARAAAMIAVRRKPKSKSSSSKNAKLLASADRVTRIIADKKLKGPAGKSTPNAVPESTKAQLATKSMGTFPQKNNNEDTHPSSVSMKSVLTEQKMLIAKLLAALPSNVGFGDLLSVPVRNFSKGSKTDPSTLLVTDRDGEVVWKLPVELADEISSHIERVSKSRFGALLKQRSSPLFIDSLANEFLEFGVPASNREMDIKLMRFQFNIIGRLYRSAVAELGPVKFNVLDAILGISIHDLSLRDRRLDFRDEFGDVVCSLNIDKSLTEAIGGGYLAAIRSSSLGGFWESHNLEKPLFMNASGQQLSETGYF